MYGKDYNFGSVELEDEYYDEPENVDPSMYDNMEYPSDDKHYITFSEVFHTCVIPTSLEIAKTYFLALAACLVFQLVNFCKYYSFLVASIVTKYSILLINYRPNTQVDSTTDIWCFGLRNVVLLFWIFNHSLCFITTDLLLRHKRDAAVQNSFVFYLSPVACIFDHKVKYWSVIRICKHLIQVHFQMINNF